MKDHEIHLLTLFENFRPLRFFILANSRGELTHCCDEAVEGLSPLRVLDCDWTEVVSEPDGRDDPARVAVSNVLLCGMKNKESVLQILMSLGAVPGESSRF